MLRLVFLHVPIWKDYKRIENRDSEEEKEQFRKEQSEELSAALLPLRRALLSVTALPKRKPGQPSREQLHACPGEVQKSIGASLVIIVSSPGALSLIPPWMRTGELS